MTFALIASIHIHCSASGFLIKEVNVTKNPVNIKSSTTTHHIANFLNEKFALAHFLTFVGLFT